MEINREEIQKIAVEAENLQRMQKAIRDQIVALNMASLESSVTINSIEKLGGGENAFISLGSGIFCSAKVQETDHFVVDIGGGAYGEVSREKAIEILKRRAEETMNVTKKLEEDLKRIQGSLTELEMRARKYIQ